MIYNFDAVILTQYSVSKHRLDKINHKAPRLLEGKYYSHSSSLVKLIT